MNRRKWTERKHTRAEWFAKLAEEFGEVAREIAVDFERPVSKQLAERRRKRLTDELDHVAFIATAFAIAESKGLTD